MEPPQAQIVRFRTRTLLTITTVLAALAAIAGPYYRAQEPLVRGPLLTHWGLTLVSLPIFLAIHWRNNCRTPTRLGAVMLVTQKTSRWNHVAFTCTVMVVATFALIALQSVNIVHDAQLAAFLNHSTVSEMFSLIWGSVFGAWILSLLLIHLLRIPVFVCEKGLSYKRQLTTWDKIRGVDWQYDRPRVVRVRRLLNGDIYLAVPLEKRSLAEAMFTEKAKLSHSGQ